MAPRPVENPLLRSYLAEMRGTLAPTTITAYRHVLARLDHLPLTLDEARQWKARRLDVVMPATVATEMRALVSFDRWYAQEMDAEPMLGKLKFPKVVVSPNAPIVSEADFRALLATCGPDAVGRRDAAVLTMLWSTGMRRGELARLTVEDLDLAMGKVMIRQSKNGEPRWSHVTPEARRAVRRYLSAYGIIGGPLWRTERGVATDAMVRAMLARRSKRAGVKVSSHQFRRAFGEQWLSLGGSETLLMSIAGWKSPAMIGRYVRSARTELALAEAARLLD